MRWLAIGCVLVCAVEARAQRVIYDGGRDTMAQQTEAAVKDLTSGALFDTMLRNVDAQAKIEADAVLAHVREEMRARVIGLERWFIRGVNLPDIEKRPATFDDDVVNCPKSVECVLRELKAAHEAALAEPAPTPAQIDAKLKEITDKIAALRAELTALKAAAKDKDEPRVAHAFALLEEHNKSVLAFATKAADLAKSEKATKALDEIGKGLDQIIKIYKVTRDIWGSRDLVTVDPASLRPPPQETEIRLLLIDQEHLQTLAAIRARQQREVRTALRQVNSAIQAMQEVPGGSVDQSLERIEDTLRTAAAGPDRARLHALVFALHEVGAAVAQMQAADLLADIRVADEARRFSIKQSAVHAGLYEFALQAAAQRLAAYWKRGLKPADIVELGAWIANTAVLVEVSRKD